jgi:predicted transcriptional regulator
LTEASDGLYIQVAAKKRRHYNETKRLQAEIENLEEEKEELQHVNRELQNGAASSLDRLHQDIIDKVDQALDGVSKHYFISFHVFYLD